MIANELNRIQTGFSSNNLIEFINLHFHVQLIDNVYKNIGKQAKRLIIIPLIVCKKRRGANSVKKKSMSILRKTFNKKKISLTYSMHDDKRVESDIFKANPTRVHCIVYLRVIRNGKNTYSIFYAKYNLQKIKHLQI